MEKWVMSGKKADFSQIAKDFGVSPIMARLLRNKDLMDNSQIETYLRGNLKDLHNPRLMKDVEKGIAIIKEKIQLQQKIRVIGDYDIDGILSTYLLVSALKRCQANVDFDIPDRIKDGYGINQTIIERACNEGVQTIVTCDNGIAAIDAIHYAKENGMTVIITDHHEMPYEEKEGERIYLETQADVVINPKQPDCEYPFKGICGAVVAYKVVEALYEEYGIDKEELYEYLPFAAFATVGDVMDLVDENRIIVKYGLKKMKSMNNAGLKALIQLNQIDMERISPYHFGFILGPCLNASGRLDTAIRALSLLTEQDEKKAEEYAGDLKALNDSRKAMTQKQVELAVMQIEQEQHEIQDKVLVIYLPDCHESLAGIIAGRIRETYNRPVYVLTKAEDGIKGSGRSIDAYHMFEELTKCKDLLLKYGGHKLAAGFSLAEDKLEAFRDRIRQCCTLTNDDFDKKIYMDMRLPISYITTDFIREISLMEPFGKGNEKPLFGEKDLSIMQARVLGVNKNVLRLLLKDSSGCEITGIYFGNIPDFEEYLTEKFNETEVKNMYLGKKNEIKIAMTYYPEINSYNGRESIQLIIQNYQ